MTGQLITIFGGSGFIGRTIVQKLAKAGHRVRVAVRKPNNALFLKPLGSVGQIQIVQANVRHEGSVAAAVQDADTVINLVGVLYESGHQSFSEIHIDGAAHIAKAAKLAGVTTLIHMSALGADSSSSSKYAQSKALGEAAVRDAFPEATIIRPSIAFGPGDNFFNRFAGLARLSPVLPVIGGDSRFQPVYVGDIADAVAAIVEVGSDAEGQTYELGGPNTYTMKDLLAFVIAETGLKRALIPLPFGLAKFKAAFLQILPSPLLTVDQVRLLAHDNVVTGNKTLATLGIIPTSVEAIVPSYLARFRHGGQFAKPAL